MHPVEVEVIGTVGRIVDVVATNLMDTHRCANYSPDQGVPPDHVITGALLNAADVLECQANVLREMVGRKEKGTTPARCSACGMILLAALALATGCGGTTTTTDAGAGVDAAADVAVCYLSSDPFRAFSCATEADCSTCPTSCTVDDDAGAETGVCK